ncbi:unnamed protein product [Anisakis simplex]|uniref:PEPCK_N domain-containing protein n=1 Tax=Anisakis simplex TaxID=6269 RepID=A0A0M3IYK6_ANISI|nr:unnamed protein product [Anisakis simplex]
MSPQTWVIEPNVTSNLDSYFLSRIEKFAVKSFDRMMSSFKPALLYSPDIVNHDENSENYLVLPVFVTELRALVPSNGRDQSAAAISQCHQNSTEYRIITKVYIRGFGGVPLIKGDPKIIPIKAQKFIAEKARLLRPRAIYICDGGEMEREDLIRELKQIGVAKELKAHNNCCLITTDQRDAHSMPIDPFIASDCITSTETNPVDTVDNPENVFEPLQNKSSHSCQNIQWRFLRFSYGRSVFAKWISPFEMGVELDERFPCAMAGMFARQDSSTNLVKSSVHNETINYLMLSGTELAGRVMYVLPFSLGPIGGRFSANAIQLTDSPYVALITVTFFRVSPAVWDCIHDKRFVRCVHSVGVQRPIIYKLENNWPCVPELALLAMSAKTPEEREVWSYGTGNESAISCLSEISLRLASMVARDEGWLAEHMAVIAVTGISHFPILV